MRISFDVIVGSTGSFVFARKLGNICTSGPMKRDSTKSYCFDRAAKLILALALLLAAIVRLRLLSMPLERDEGEYAYIGQQILQGVPPYVSAYNMKFPGIYAAYALVMAAFGQTIPGIRLGLLTVNVATVILIFLLGRRLMNSLAGAVAACAYALLSVSAPVLGMTANAEHFVLLPAVAGILVVIRAVETGSPAWLLAAGLLFGTAMMVKQQGAAFALFGALYVALHVQAKRRSLVQRLVSVAVYGLGIVIPFTVTCLVMWHCGALDRFWLWTIKYSRDYASQLPLSRGLKVFLGQTYLVVKEIWPIWLAAAVGGVVALRRPNIRQWRLLIVLLLFFSFAAICPGLYFRLHYYILLLPVVSLLIGAILATKPNTANLAFVALAFVTSIYLQSQPLFVMTNHDLVRKLYGPSPFPESIKIADYIRAHSAPSDTIAVLGSEPQICFYANRRSATGYIYTCALLEKHLLAQAMQEDMIAQIEAARPRFIVYVAIPTSWMDVRDKRNSCNLIFDWIENYIPRYYTRVGLVDIMSGRWTNYYYGRAAAQRTPASSHCLYVFRRRLRVEHWR